jgi:hypothetical protein
MKISDWRKLRSYKSSSVGRLPSVLGQLRMRVASIHTCTRSMCRYAFGKSMLLCMYVCTYISGPSVGTYGTVVKQLLVVVVMGCCGCGPEYFSKRVIKKIVCCGSSCVCGGDSLGNGNLPLWLLGTNHTLLF